MNVFYLSVGIIGSIVWAIVPVFQRHGKYYYYFAVIAVSAVYGLIYVALPISIPTRMWLPLSVLALPGFFRGFFKKYLFYLISAGIVLYIVSHFIDVVAIQVIAAFFAGIKFLTACYLIFGRYKSDRRVESVLLLIVINEALIFLKISLLIADPFGSLLVFYIITIIQLGIGTAFIFIKE